MYINKIQYNWKREAGFCVSGAVYGYYNLFLFPTPVQIKKDGEIINTQPNACIMHQPRQKRWFCLPDKGAICWLHAYKDVAPLLKQYEIPLNQVFYPEDPELVATLMERIHVEFYSGGRNREQMIDALFQTLVVALSRNDVLAGESAGGNSAEKRKMQELRASLLSQPDRKWNVAEMAREVSLSPSRFHAVYKAMFGTTPGQDLIRGKMDCAKSLLLMDEYIPLATIAERLGYSSQYHFIRQFKQTTGMTPGAYRKSK